MYRWGVVINEESLAVALQKLVEAGIIKLKSAARLKYDEAAKSGGYAQAHQDILDSFMRRVHLIHDPSDDRTFENCAHLFDAMKGREFNERNLAWCLRYLQGRGGRGTKLHWETRPRQNAPQNRGHIARSAEDYRFAPKEDTNLHPLSRFSHASDARFNGENDRKKMQRPGAVEEDVMASTNRVWMMQAKTLAGRTHSETLRIQKIVDSTPGGGYTAYQAGLREQRMIENERTRGR